MTFMTMKHFLTIAGLVAASSILLADEEISYARQILPILSDKCFQCHGPDKETQEAGLRLDIRKDAIKELAWDPKNPPDSKALIRIFSSDPDEIMPPPKSHLKLTKSEMKLIKRWVEEGAEYEAHWAFVAPPKNTPIPKTKNSAWLKNPIDSFILARLEQEKLSPTKPAPPERWIRRVTFDLTGLPPTQPEIKAFTTDTSPEAREKVVDRLLNSPKFGEHMAVQWLDIARYADSFGYQADINTDAWPYRDWVIRTFNKNLPYDEFIIEQLAGDLLEKPTRDQKLATAFNRIHRKTNEGGSIAEEFRQDGIADRVQTVSVAFMGLTFECARCHDHKYDPITAKDYYSAAAFFNSIPENGLLKGGNVRSKIAAYPTLQLPSADQESELATLQKKVNSSRLEWKAYIDQPNAEFDTWLKSKRTYPTADIATKLKFEQKDLKNSVKSAPKGKLGSNRLAPGKNGNSLLTDGDSVTKLGNLGISHADQAFSFSLWIKPSKKTKLSAIFSNTPSSGPNYTGYNLNLQNGKLHWTIARELPGCAAMIKMDDELPLNTWTHITVTNDGSRKAAGMHIYINGQEASTQVICDNLLRDILVNSTISIGARHNDPGFPKGMIDDFTVYKRAITALEAAQLHDPKSVESASTEQLRDYYFSAVNPKARKLSTNYAKARADYRDVANKVREVIVMKETTEPVPAYILERGDYASPGKKVERETPDWLPPFPKNQPVNRLGYAKWLTSPDHPLTARVSINRIWQSLFGAGIVATSDNFGLQGQQPTHPELLDWLARDFINHGWDHKGAIRQMVLSSTYAQDSGASKKLRERDPTNKLLARGPARRLTAEQLRDSALAVSGLLVKDIGGPPAKPYQAPGSMWKTLNNFLPVYKSDKGSGLYRRSLYTFWRRTTTPPNMMIFDANSRDVCATRRQVTNTPLQPLVMLNDPQFVEAARKLGERILRDGGKTDTARATWAYREVTGRTLNAKQLPHLIKLIQEQRAYFKSADADAKKLLSIGDSKIDSSLDPIELATASMLAQAIINLDANITLR